MHVNVVYDSLSLSMPQSLRNQICCLYEHYAKGDDKLIQVDVVHTQQQVGSSDCGLFAIANVMALASGIDIERVTFRQTKMRSHFLQCLQEQRLTMFPHKVSDSSNSRLRRKVFVITMNCHCNAFLPNSNLIKCSECNKLLHLQCLTHSHQNSNSRHTVPLHGHARFAQKTTKNSWLHGHGHGLEWFFVLRMLNIRTLWMLNYDLH